MKKRCVLLLMTAMLITLGGCSKETENKTASDEKAVASEQSAPEEEETTTEEQSTEETEDIPDEKEVDPFEEVRNMEKVTSSELCDRMEDFFTNLAEDSLYRRAHLRVGDYSIQDMSQYYSVAWMHIVSDYDDANFDIYELSEESKKGMSGDATHYNVDISPVVDNFYGEYRYYDDTTQKLMNVVKVKVHSYNEHNSDVDLTNEFYAVVTMEYSGGSWDICGAILANEGFFLTDRGEVIRDAFVRSTKQDVVFSDNVAEAKSKIDMNDPSTVIPFYEEWYHYVVASSQDSSNVELTPQVSLCYIDGDDIPELVVWETDQDGYSYGSVYGYSGGKIYTYCENESVGNEGIDKSFRYTPYEGEFLMINANTTGTYYSMFRTYIPSVTATYEVGSVYVGLEHGVEVCMVDGEYVEIGGADERLASYNSLTGTVSTYDTVQEAFDNLNK